MPEHDTETDVREIAGHIVASFLQNNHMPPENVPQFITDVMNALKNGAAVTEEEAPEPRRLTPAVPVKKSFGPDHVTCLICGKRMKTLRRHLGQHEMDEQTYRQAFNLREDHPLVSLNYSEQRREQAKRIGLGQRTTTRGRPRKKAA